MWLSLFTALLSWLLSPKGTPEERRKALMNAALVGGGTYLATEYTDWGANISDQFNGLIGAGGSSMTEQQAAQAALAAGGSSSSGSGSSTGLGSLGGWVVPALTAGGGLLVGSGALKNIPGWVWLAGAGLGLYLIFKD